MKRKRILIIVAAAGIVLAATAMRFAGGARETPSTSLPTTAEVTSGDMEVTVEATGIVEAIRTVEVKSRVSGEVLDVRVDSGDHVKKGDRLVEIDPRDVRNDHAQAKADLESAQVHWETADAERIRTQALREANVITPKEYEAAVEAAASARSALVRAQTSLQLAEEKLGDVRIEAPIDGTVIDREVEPGQIISSATGNISGGTALFLIADLTEMRVRTLVDETDIGRVTPGQSAEVTVEAYSGRIFRGKIEKIEPRAVVEQNVTMFPVLVRLDNPDELLKPGMNAEVEIEIASREKVVLAPNSAVVGLKYARSMAKILGVDDDRVDAGRTEAVNGRPGVAFVQGAAGIEVRTVATGLSDWDHTEILAGLEPGERVVVVTTAQLQQEQQEVTDRFRSRQGGVIPGAGGGPPPGGGPGR